VVAVAAASPRALPADALAAHVRAAWPGVAVEVAASVAQGVTRALRENDGLVLACGSLFVVGEAMAAVGGAAGLEQL
jgi:folylpolyglutamate synthase/dihydropteroate synthase